MKIASHQKNVFPAQISSKGLNPEIEEVFDYIYNAMQTLKEFENRFRSRNGTGKTPQQESNIFYPVKDSQYTSINY